MLEEKLSEDIKTAMKSKETLVVSTLRLITAALKNLRIDKQVETLDDTDVIAVLKKQAKQRQDSIDQFTKAGRMDLADKETAELAIIKKYLPEELSEEKVREIIDAAIAETGASSMKEMGSVMKAVMSATHGAADNKLVSTLVREKLS